MITFLFLRLFIFSGTNKGPALIFSCVFNSWNFVSITSFNILGAEMKFSILKAKKCLQHWNVFSCFLFVIAWALIRLFVKIIAFEYDIIMILNKLWAQTLLSVDASEAHLPERITFAKSAGSNVWLHTWVHLLKTRKLWWEMRKAWFLLYVIQLL